MAKQPSCLKEQAVHRRILMQLRVVREVTSFQAQQRSLRDSEVIPTAAMVVI